MVLGTNLSRDELKIGKVLMIILVINIAMTFPNTVFNSIVQSKENYFFQKSLNLIATIASPLITLPLLLIGFRSIAVVCVQTGITFACLLINIFYCLNKLHTKFVFANMDFRIVKEIGAFSIFLFINQIVDQINWNIDKFILGRVCGTVTVAVYSVGWLFNFMYQDFSTFIATVYDTRINNWVAEGVKNNIEKIRSLFIKVGRLQLIILGLILSGFSIFGRDFIKLWLGEDYLISYYVALIMMIPSTISLIQTLGVIIQRAENMHRFRSIIYLAIAVCNILVSIPLAYRLGSIGTALGTGFALIIGNGVVMNWFYDRRLFLDIKRFWKSLVSILIPLVMIWIMFIVLKTFVEVNSYITLFCLMAVYAMFYIVVIYLWGLNAEEKDSIKNSIDRIL